MLTNHLMRRIIESSMDRRPWGQEPEPVIYEEGKLDYTKGQLNQLADDFLREDSRTELCLQCSKKGKKNGRVTKVKQDAEDDSGATLLLAFDQYECENGHSWHEGEGKPRGIKGENPILFEEHLQSRKRREISPGTGTPEDPRILMPKGHTGLPIYNRTHPQGRKVNSPEQRRKNGASYFR